MNTSLKLGTRGSKLALIQTRLVAELLSLPTEIVTIVTSGDLKRGVGDKSRWVDSIEQALVDGEIDIAVHCAKDVPGELADGCELIAALPRGPVEDVLVGADSLEALPVGARIGTSSLRRRSQLLGTRPDLIVEELRGNVDTRLGLLAEGRYDAIVLAAAGVVRLGREAVIGTRLLGDLFVPAPGQGTLVLEGRKGDERVRTAVAELNDDFSWNCLLAERTLVEALAATCHTPVGAYASLVSDEHVTLRPFASNEHMHLRTFASDGQILLRAFAGLPDGTAWLTDELIGDLAEPVELGTAVAERMLAAGAAELLKDADAQARDAAQGKDAED